MMGGLQIRYLGYFGPDKSPASLVFDSGLNVVCGASETGKSFVAESIDFMLGQEDPVRDIPERDGYDRVRLVIESIDFPPLTLDRGIEGGHFRAYEGVFREEAPQVQTRTLRWQHSAARQDTLSYAMLERTGLGSKILRKSAAETRSLSFRDLVRLCVVTEEEIQRRGSPLLSGQYTTATVEYAAFKLLLTGLDDSSMVSVKEEAGRHEQESGKIELLNQLIEELQAELDEVGADEEELTEQLVRLEASIRDQNAALASVQSEFNAVLSRRGSAASELRTRKARLIEINELVGRFELLDAHYQTDLDRLTAIRESGSLFVHLEQRPCPLCGASPGDQHLDAECEGNTEAVVKAADAELAKVRRLRAELESTVVSLKMEQKNIQGSLAGYESAYADCEKELAEIAAPAVSSERASYNELISARSGAQSLLDKIGRLKRFVEQRTQLENQESGPKTTATRTHISSNVLDEFSKVVESILEEWHFPNATRVFFDESARDFQIAGKARGSTGKGLRAITHAAVNIGLMVFCRERSLPHPGFVVLDSPLLAYWKPEGADDDLRGTDLKEMFYRYLLGLDRQNQVIIIENEHPPSFVSDVARVTVFTKNPHEGRYGFFPTAG